MTATERLEKHFTKLEATLASEQSKWEQERVRLKMDNEQRSPALLQNYCKLLQASLELSEEREKTAVLE